MLSDFAKEKVFWTRKMNLKLVKFIERRPNIWNPKHPKYTSVKYRDQTYAEFALKYGDEFTGQAVKDRWTNIRSTYANYLRKLNASRAKGDKEYKVNWHLWHACHFLSKVNKSVRNDPSTSEPQLDETENQAKCTTDQQDEVSSDDDLLDSPSNNKNITCKNIADNLIAVLKGVQNDAFGLGNTRHGRIGRTVAKKLSQMNTYDAARASKQIMEILLLYDEHNPENPNNLKSDLTMSDNVM